MFHLWKEGQATEEMFKNVARSCKKKIREAKAQLEFNLTTSVKDNKNVFINTLTAKGGARKTSILYWTQGNRVTKDEEMAKVLNTCFASVFNIKTGPPQDNWPSELIDRDKEKTSPLNPGGSS